MGEVLELDTVVVGGGVVGLACARALALAGREVHVLEAESRLGVHTSARSSEVIHAGIYYPPGSLKARLCVAGREALYRYCEARAIAHRRVGKLIVASATGELTALGELEARARENGVDDLVPLTPGAVRRLEPAVRCAGALLSPSTGIVDSHALMHALLADARAAGATLVVRSPVLAGALEERGFTLSIGGADACRVRCRTLVNAAGLFAQRLSASLGLSAEHTPPCHYAKGHYYGLLGPSPFARLVYPLPDAHGLGVHVTLDLAGCARFGPDVSWVDAVDYAFDEGRRSTFERAIRRYYPALPDGALAPAYTGIRPKLAPAGSPARDFVVQGEREHGIPGLVQLFGIESPGLTASLALAELVGSYLT